MTTHRYASGLASERDFVTVEPPGESAGYGENHAFWIHDEASGLQINGHINTCEDVGAYDQRVNKMSVNFPNGRLLLIRESGAGSDARTAAAGGLRFQCVAPFERWSCRFQGIMQDATITRNYMTGAPLDYFRVPVSFEVQTEMLAPAWIQGAFTEGGLGPVASFIGGERYEQLFRHTGKLSIGTETYSLSGYGNRTHRYGRRDLSATPSAARMLGHVWAAAIFPSGAGFAFQSYPMADGAILWSEAVIVRSGRLVPVTVVKAPWLSNYWLQGEPIEIRLKDADGGLHEIRGETLGTVVGQMLPGLTAAEQVPLFQSHVRYTMNGENAINMLERSLRRVCIETGDGRPR
ncbi:MAG: hypothetical protein AB7Q97_13210 [Gammaproteobacteria bacterium]